MAITSLTGATGVAPNTLFVMFAVRADPLSGSVRMTRLPFFNSLTDEMSVKFSVTGASVTVMVTDSVADSVP